MDILYLVHEPRDHESRVADVLSARGCDIEFRCHVAADPLPQPVGFDVVIVGGLWLTTDVLTRVG